MKSIKNVCVGIFAMFVLFSCSDEVIYNKNSTSNNILHFETEELMEQELDLVLKMTTEEKAIWASSKGFSSYGVQADLFYDTIDPESFKSEEEIIQFVNNSKYLEIRTDDQGEKSVEIVSGDNRYRYFINDSSVFTVGDQAVKLIGKSTVYTCIDNLEELNKIDDIEIIADNVNYEIFQRENVLLKSTFPGCGLGDTDDDKTATVGGRTYRVKLEIWVEDNFRGGTNYAETFYKITSQRTTLGIFFNYRNYITYNIMLRSHFQNGFGNWQYHIFNISGVNVRTRVIEGSESTKTANYNLNTWIHFDEYNCQAYVPQTINNKAGFTCN